MAERIQGAIDRIKDTVKHGKLKFKKRKMKDNVLKDSRATIPDREREKICKDAMEKAHSAVANVKREVSNAVRKDLQL